MPIGGYMKVLGLCGGILLFTGGSTCVPSPPDELWVLDPNDNLLKGNGDEVALGRIRFHATFGQPGSAVVDVDNRLQQLGKDVEKNRKVVVPRDLVGIGRFDFGGAPVVDWEDEVLALNKPIVISGSVAIALELDTLGTEEAKEKISNAGDKLRDALEFFIAGPNGAVHGLGDLERLVIVAKGFYCTQAVLADMPLTSLCPDNPDHPEWSGSGGGSSIGKWFFDLFFRNTGHDLIGTGGVLSLNLKPADFDAKIEQLRMLLSNLGLPAEAIPSCEGEELAFVLCAPQDGAISLHFKGEDAHWRLDTPLILPD